MPDKYAPRTSPPRKARDTIARRAAKAKTVEATVAMWNDFYGKRGSFSDEHSTL